MQGRRGCQYADVFVFGVRVELESLAVVRNVACFCRFLIRIRTTSSNSWDLLSGCLGQATKLHVAGETASHTQRAGSASLSHQFYVNTLRASLLEYGMNTLLYTLERYRESCLSGCRSIGPMTFSTFRSARPCMSLSSRVINLFNTHFGSEPASREGLVYVFMT